MPNKKNLLFIAFSIFLILTGCQSTPTPQPLQNEETEQQLLTEKLNAQNSFKKQVENYNLFGTVTLHKEEVDRIVYEVTVDQTKQVMKNVGISAHLHPSMNELLQTSNVFFTNIVDIATKPEQFLLEPDGAIKGVQLFRAFVLDPAKINTTFHNSYKQVFVKVSYQDADGKEHVDYVQLEARPSKELTKYILTH